MNGWLAKYGKLCAEHSIKILLIWVLLIICLAFGASKYGGHITNTFSLPGSDSQKATDLIEQEFPNNNNGTAQIVFYSPNAPLNETSITSTLSKLSILPNVSSVTNPFTTGTISKNGQIAYANINYSLPITQLGPKNLEDINSSINNISGLQVYPTGQLASTYGSSGKDYSEAIGLVSAAIILLITFGSFVAMGLPLVSSITGLIVGTLATLLVAKFVNIPSVGPAVATMIGIGVGIDYALFIISRHIENMATGTNIKDSIAKSIGTSGKAVVVAGTTVIIANMGLLVVGIPIVSAMALATAIAVASAMLVAIGLLPAILGALGKNVTALKVPMLNKSKQSNFWRGWALHVTNHPWRYITLSLIILSLLILPVLKIQLGPPSPISGPNNSPGTKAYNLLTEGFGVGINNPLLITVKLPQNANSENIEILNKTVNKLRQTNGVVSVTPPILNESGTASIITVTPSTSQNDPNTTKLINNIENNVLPSITENTNATAYVGGVTAVFIDITDKITSRMIPFIGLVLLLTFILLVFVFRSLFIPLKAVVMNLLSVLSAFGIIVMIFQWGWGKNLIDLTTVGPIVSYVPMMIFAILFGLSMDYEVFILTRVKEEYKKSGDNKKAVIEGIAHTAKLITAAALVMISVFLAFVSSSDPVIKMFGVGLAFAVFIDATLIRLVLVPATMDVAGKINWWFPAWLKKIIPDFKLE